MNAFRKAPTALALAVGMATLIAPAFAASTDHPMRHPARHHAADFARARALASPAIDPLAPSPRAPETDGLSRNDDDCNMGCIDH